MPDPHASAQPAARPAARPADAAGQRCTLLLMPGFSLAALAGMLDAWQAANALLARPGAPAAYPVRLMTPAADATGGARAGVAAPAGGVSAPALVPATVTVRCGAGTLLLAEALVPAVVHDVVAQADALFVLGTETGPAATRIAPDAEGGLPARLLLLQAAAAGRVLGGVGSGSAWLAQAGVLRGHRVAVHWALAGALAEAHPELLVTQRRTEIDRARLSAAGPGAARELVLGWLRQRHGEAFARELAAQLGLDALPGDDDRQRVPLGARLAAPARHGSAKLAEALALMEANLAEPLPTEDIARLVGVSRRQLERLFKQHLDALPSRWYLQLRLERAQRLLRQTSQSVLQIGLGCGFASGPHFSNAYRAHFGHTPRDERSPRVQAWRDGGAGTAAPAGESP